jgi:UDP-N-acetylmuramate-alanine ligase
MSEIKNIYFLGIGGIGMSALARYYNSKGYKVSGYDRTRTPLTIELENEGIDIHYSPAPPSSPEGGDVSSLQNKYVSEGSIKNELNQTSPPSGGLGGAGRADLVVYTPAIPEDFEEFVYFKNNGFKMLKRAQVLGEITRNSKGICIAGTHGKTTTSTMTAHLIYSSEVGCSAFLGGVSKNYDKNILLASPSLPEEGDVSKRAFEYLTANIENYGLLKEFAQNMCKFSTEAETALWEMLRRKNLDVRFRKQHIIGDFIVDFVCLKEKLIVEVDGGCHNEPEAAEYDKIRTQILNDLGFKVIRFTNEEVIGNPDDVLSKIKNELNQTSPHSGGLGGDGRAEFVVIEADEYDRSFHQLTPYMALITAADADHLDIYGDKDEFRRSFEKFASLVQENGYLIVRHGIELDLHLNKNVKHYTYSGGADGDFHAENIKIGNGEITFDFVTPKETVKDIHLGVPVLINVENGVGAMALAYLAGVKPDELRLGMASFKGIKRRFDIQVKNDKIVYLDDYAHHPEELKASISSIKLLYPNRKVCGIFQPHLYTRTRDFRNEFAQSLSLLDELILLDIYPARELPIEGVSSDIIFDKVTIENKIRAKKEDLLDILNNKIKNTAISEGQNINNPVQTQCDSGGIDVLVTFGAGDIDAYVPKIKNLLEEKCQKD